LARPAASFVAGFGGPVYDRTAATITALARLAITLICARRLPTD
jgi:hypothetical protein